MADKTVVKETGLVSQVAVQVARIRADRELVVDIPGVKIRGWKCRSTVRGIIFAHSTVWAGIGLTVLRQDTVHHVSVDVSKPKVPALVFVG